MTRNPDNPDPRDHAAQWALLLGVGLDNTDQHVRVTRGDEFYLVGGSDKTHGRMQEKAVRFTEELDRLGKHLREISPEEFRDIAQRIRLHEP